jgi:hypothetical protein
VTDPDDETPERSTFSWIVLGALGIVVVLVPLSMLSFVLLNRLGGGTVNAMTARFVVVAAATLALASTAGGWFLGRYGKDESIRPAALSGVLVGAFLAALSRAPASLVVIAITAPFAALGARLGLRARKRESG